MKHMSYAESLLRAMNPVEYAMRDEVRLEHYKDLKQQHASPKTFEKAERAFIKEYFFDDTEFYKEWRKENERYFD